MESIKQTVSALEQAKARLRQVLKKCRERKRVGRVLDAPLKLRDLVEVYDSQQGKCFYTGLDMLLEPREQYTQDSRDPLYLSLDRVDKSKGYEKDNVVLCCLFVNYAKNEWTLEELAPLWARLPTHP